jgi:CheY-like chemotaxis protein
MPVKIKFTHLITHSKSTILLADDDDDDRVFFREALEQLNFAGELISVNNGEKVIDFFKSTARVPDFVFLDINMPRLNGIECLKFISDVFPDRNFHVIMLSTATAHTVVEQSYLLGASLYIQKPNKFNDLAKYLNYCLTRLERPASKNNFLLNENFECK